MSSTTPPFGFNPFAPGFDFLHNLVKNGASPGAGSAPLSSWVAPTLDPEELDKRIAELKTVHYWLDQNTKALAATIQALEVQKMTLAALQTMNFNMAEVAKAFQMPGSNSDAKPGQPKDAASPAQTETASAPEAGRARISAKGPRANADMKPQPSSAADPPAVDPLQMWSALTEQFQQIAASTMRDLGKASGQEAVSRTQAGATGKAKSRRRSAKAAGTAKSAKD